MKTVSTVKELQSLIKSTNLSPLGFVPTMGALHAGHISLVSSAVGKCPLVVVSIYVNPVQFNDKDDLMKYPRTPGDDTLLLQKVLRDTDIVFTPDDKEIYPEPVRREFHFGNLDMVMEAVQRPGHFNGVATVVSRFFEIIRPDFAFFGQKDFQQLAVIEELVRQTGVNVKIIANPIVREADGLAMSSRNRLLDPEIRKNAGIIYKTLKAASGMIPGHDISDIRAFVKDSIESAEGFRVEYFEIADDRELVTVNKAEELDKKKKYFGCIAVKAGKIRLIDNIEFRL